MLLFISLTYDEIAFQIWTLCIQTIRVFVFGFEPCFSEVMIFVKLQKQIFLHVLIMPLRVQKHRFRCHLLDIEVVMVVNCKWACLSLFSFFLNMIGYVNFLNASNRTQKITFMLLQLFTLQDWGRDLKFWIVEVFETIIVFPHRKYTFVHKMIRLFAILSIGTILGCICRLGFHWWDNWSETVALKV